MDYLSLLLLTVGILIVFIVIGVIGIASESHNWSDPYKMVRNCILILLSIVALIGGDAGLRTVYKNHHSVCRNKDILSLLKNDLATPEFVLENSYYSLPFRFQQLIDNGWDSVLTKKERESVSLDLLSLYEGAYADFLIFTPYGQINLIVTQTTQSNNIGDAIVVGVYYRSGMEKKELEVSPNPDFFVTKYGLTETTSYEMARELTAGKIDQSSFWFTPRTEGKAIDLKYYGNNYDFRTQNLIEYTSMCYPEYGNVRINGGEYIIENNNVHHKTLLSLFSVRIIALSIIGFIISLAFVLIKKYMIYISICHVPRITDKLLNDRDTPEFILNNQSYQLPFPIRRLIRYGWKIRLQGEESWGDINSKQCGTVLLQTEQYIFIILTTPYGQLTLTAEGSAEKGGTLEDAMIVGARYETIQRSGQRKKPADRYFFVTKHGLTETSDTINGIKLLKESGAWKHTKMKPFGEFKEGPRHYGITYEIQSDRYNELYSEKKHPQYVGSYEAILERKDS